jgi:hypothetical protein
VPKATNLGFHGYLLVVAFQHPAADLRFYLGGVGIDATEPELRSAFAEVGVALSHIELVVNRATGFKRGFAFVHVNAPPKGSAITRCDILERMQAATVNGRPSTVRLIAARD